MAWEWIFDMEIQVIASGSTGNAYLVNDGTTSVLLDAGVPLKQIQAACRYQLNRIKGCFISHSHKDHSKAAEKLAERGINIYLAADTLQEIKGQGHRFKVIEPQQQIEVGNLIVMPFALEHDVNNYGYLIFSKATKEKLVYITDTAYCRYRFTGLTHIMIETNYDKNVARENVLNSVIPDSLRERVTESHMSIDTALEFIKANQQPSLRQIYLLHLSNHNSLADRFKLDVQAISGVEVMVC